MENEKININTIIYETSEDKCKKCNQILEQKSVELKYEGFTTTRWQKEKIKYCKKCKTYYIYNEKINEFEKKYPSYRIKEIGKTLPNKISELECFVCTNRNHLICNNQSTQDRFVTEKIMAEKAGINLPGNHPCD